MEGNIGGEINKKHKIFLFFKFSLVDIFYIGYRYIYYKIRNKKYIINLYYIDIYINIKLYFVGMGFIYVPGPATPPLSPPIWDGSHILVPYEIFPLPPCGVVGVWHCPPVFVST